MSNVKYLSNKSKVIEFAYFTYHQESKDMERFCSFADEISRRLFSRRLFFAKIDKIIHGSKYCVCNVFFQLVSCFYYKPHTYEVLIRHIWLLQDSTQNAYPGSLTAKSLWFSLNILSFHCTVYFLMIESGIYLNFLR